MTIWIVALAVVFQLALWLSLRRRIDALPLRIGGLVRRERVDAAERAQAMLQEATAAKVGPLVSAIRILHDQMRQDLVAQLVESKRRARSAEGRANEAGAAMTSALALVRELRAVLDDLTAGADAEEEERRTVEVPLRSASGEHDDEDRTTVAARPAILPPPGNHARALQPEAR